MPCSHRCFGILSIDRGFVLRMSDKFAKKRFDSEEEK